MFFIIPRRMNFTEPVLFRSRTSVGTPDYISPEVLQTYEVGGGKYGKECDWWSLGICMYEMLYGDTPFYAESLAETYGKIMNHRDRFYFPTDSCREISDDAKSLIRQLICDRETRFGRGGLADFKAHGFFYDINWDNIRSTQPPYIPEIISPTDTSNFPDEHDDPRIIAQTPVLGNASFSGKNLPFVGFTFTRNSKLSDTGMQQLNNLKTDKNADIAEKENINSTSNGISSDKINQQSSYIQNLEQSLARVKQEKNDLRRELTEMKEKLKHQSTELSKKNILVSQLWSCFRSIQNHYPRIKISSFCAGN